MYANSVSCSVSSLLSSHGPRVSVSLSLQLLRHERPHVQQSCSVRTHHLDSALVRILWFWWKRMLRPPRILYRRSFTAALMFPLWSLHTAASGGSKPCFKFTYLWFSRDPEDLDELAQVRLIGVGDKVCRASWAIFAESHSAKQPKVPEILLDIGGM